MSILSERSHNTDALYGQLQSFAEACHNPQQQWEMLDAALVGHTMAESYQFTQLMLDVAASDVVSDSLAVRARALELAASELKWAEPTEDVEPFQRLKAGLQKTLPEYFEVYTPPALATGEHYDHELPEAYEFTTGTNLVSDMAYGEGLDSDMVSGYISQQYEDENGSTYYRFEADHPGVGVLPHLVAARYVDEQDGYRYPSQVIPDGAKRLFMHELVTALPAMIRGEQVPGRFSDIMEYVRLGRFETITMHTNREPINYLVELGTPEALAYTRLLNEQYDVAGVLHEVFPPGFNKRVAYGAQDIVSRAVYAAADHIKNGHSIKGELPLLNGHAIDVTFKDDEPMGVLQFSLDALQELHSTVTNKDMFAVPARDGKGYRVDHLFNDAHVSRVNSHNRPMGDRAFDITEEYGRHYEGVEATMGYTVEPYRKSGVVPVAKKHKGLQSISVRLDREARPYPGATEGKLSLDIGSVLGDPRNMGTKVGQLLAWGDVVRARHATPESTKLNHDATFLAGFGKADIFMRHALAHDARIGAKRIGPQEVARRVAPLATAHVLGRRPV